MITTQANNLCCVTAHQAVRAGLGARPGLCLDLSVVAREHLAASAAGAKRAIHQTRAAAKCVAQMKKARRIRQALINLVAGAGFEPTTFGL